MLLETLRNDLLPQVTKPGQYLGNEWGARNKDWDSSKSRIALIYPDLYELGMSNFGIKILYNLVNDHPDYLADRAYAPMPDMEALLRERKLALWGWESYKPLNEFDFLGFSLGYELCYTNIFTILDLPKIPFESCERDHSDPLIFAGGPAAFNPEPMANYIDFYIIGDGEELIIEMQDSMLKSKQEFLQEHPEILKRICQINPGSNIEFAIKQLKNFPLETELSKALRQKILLDLAQLQGIYVPQFYKPDPNDNYIPKKMDCFSPLGFAMTALYPVKKRITQNLTESNQPVTGPVPHISTIQDKQVLEIRRGCDRGCRFCQVGYTYLPVRERSPEDLLKASQESVRKSGYEDYTLLSLSASDYTCLTEAARALNDEHAANGVSLSMPSQRADRFNLELSNEVSQVRKSGMTFAPEAGTEKMRKIINKGLTQEDIQNAIRGSYMSGWSHIKLYFMIGLPFETDEDLDGILDILTWSVNMSRQLRKSDPKRYRKPIDITCTISTFVPKSFTAFQWFPQCSVEEFHRKEDYLKQGLRQRKLGRAVKLNCTEPELALIEAVLSRGDRRWGKVIRHIWESGSRLDAWSENFDITRWHDAAEAHDLCLQEEAYRYRKPGSKQAWDVLSIGFTDKFLLDEWQQAVNIAETPACTENKCHACGVCFNLDVKNIVTKDQSDANPFVTEIDKEKRQEVCASTPRNDAENVNTLPGQPKVIVKHTQAQQKLRLKITKLQDLRFISHLDFQRLIERALRRSGLKLVHTTGYNQRIKISWGQALPLFLESNGEYLEIGLADRFDNLEDLKQILNNELPKQARIIEVREILPEDKVTISKVLEAVYKAKLIQITQPDNGSRILITDSSNQQNPILNQERIESFLNQDSIMAPRGSTQKQGTKSKGKEQSKNLKEQIIAMKLLDSSSLEITLRASQRADQVLNALIPGSIWMIRKESQTLSEPAKA